MTDARPSSAVQRDLQDLEDEFAELGAAQDRLNRRKIRLLQELELVLADERSSRLQRTSR